MSYQDLHFCTSSAQVLIFLLMQFFEKLIGAHRGDAFFVPPHCATFLVVTAANSAHGSMQSVRCSKALESKLDPL